MSSHFTIASGMNGGVGSFSAAGMAALADAT